MKMPRLRAIGLGGLKEIEPDQKGNCDMKMKGLKVSVLGALLCWAATAGAAMIYDFNGLKPGDVVTPFGGFDWGNLIVGGESGGNTYAVGNSSPTVITRINPAELWNFEGALLKSASAAGTVTLTGFLGGSQAWSIAAVPLGGTFAFLNPGTTIAQQYIDTLQISVSGAGQWMMDDFLDTVAPTVPEPSSFIAGALLCIPIAIGLLRRRGA